LSGEKRKGGDGVHSARRRVSNGANKKKKRGEVQYGDEGEK
jgi:hypothetical protein